MVRTRCIFALSLILFNCSFYKDDSVKEAHAYDLLINKLKIIKVLPIRVLCRSLRLADLTIVTYHVFLSYIYIVGIRVSRELNNDKLGRQTHY